MWRLLLLLFTLNVDSGAFSPALAAAAPGRVPPGGNSASVPPWADGAPVGVGFTAWSSLRNPNPESFSFTSN